MKLKTKFQDEDFELGEVVKAEVFTYRDDDNKVVVMVDTAGDCAVRFEYNSIKDFTDHWEDAPKEPEDDGLDNIIALAEAYSNHDSERYPKEIVEKLKAFTRLKEKGFKFRWIDMQTGEIKYGFFLKKWQKVTRGDEDDLMLLFGGEE